MWICFECAHVLTVCVVIFLFLCLVCILEFRFQDGGARWRVFMHSVGSTVQERDVGKLGITSFKNVSL